MRQFLSAGQEVESDTDKQNKRRDAGYESLLSCKTVCVGYSKERISRNTD